MIEKILKSVLFLAVFAGPASAQTLHRATPAPVQTEAQRDADPALWVVRDADTTIYLFGTFHMLDGRPWFNDEIRTAFDASQELVLEAIQPTDPAAIASRVSHYALDTQRRPLSQRIGPEESARLARALEAEGLPAMGALPIDPWYASITVTVAAVQRLGLAGEHGAETTLSAAARTRNMPIAELEGFEWQLRLMDGLPEDLQLVQLRATLDELARLPQMIGPALDAWSRGDVERLAEVLDDPADSDPRLRRILLTERNVTWVRWIRERLARPGTVFVAVGAGHLAGRDSVQDILAREGLRAERVLRSSGQ